MIPERYRDFLSEISGKFPIGNFGKLPRPISIHDGSYRVPDGPHMVPQIKKRMYLRP